ncbi:MAG: brain acid soluble protein 1 [Clostridia bacterium]|nr:brain acid soluble protein 1 [Clostridia bacterium]
MNGFKKALALLAALSLVLAFASGCADGTGTSDAGTSGKNETETAASPAEITEATETTAGAQPSPDTTEGGSDTSDAVPVSEEQTEITTDAAGESETEPTPDTSSEAPDTSSEAPDTSSEAPDTSTDAPETSDTTPAGTEPTEPAEQITLTAAQIDTIKKAVSFICRAYRYAADSLSNDDDLAKAAARMFPDKVTVAPRYMYDDETGEPYEVDGTIEEDPFEVDLTDDELLQFARSEWPYMADATLRDKIVSLIVKRGGIDWGNCGGHGMGPVLNGKSGSPAGYTVNGDTVSFYCALKLGIWDAIDERGWDYNTGHEVDFPVDVELDPFDYFNALAESSNGEDFEFEGYVLTRDTEGKYILKDYQTRVFRFKLTSDGKAEYISDDWSVDIPYDSMILL